LDIVERNGRRRGNGGMGWVEKYEMENSEGEKKKKEENE
jgi:hypothetical protein